jgi:V/A-type H+/Na+-transporting ATPase subunit G/H
MTQAIEETIKALTEFEAELDSVGAEAMDAGKRLQRSAAEWAEAAKERAVSRAKQLAEARIAEAKKGAEKEAEDITKKAQSSLKKYEESMSKRKSAAVEAVLARLLGESQ